MWFWSGKSIITIYIKLSETLPQPIFKLMIRPTLKNQLCSYFREHLDTCTIEFTGLLCIPFVGNIFSVDLLIHIFITYLRSYTHHSWLQCSSSKLFTFVPLDSNHIQWKKAQTGLYFLDEYFMGVALLSARRSKDPNTQVGACKLLWKQRSCWGRMYNALPIGCDDDDFPWGKTRRFSSNQISPTTAIRAHWPNTKRLLKSNQIRKSPKKA